MLRLLAILAIGWALVVGWRELRPAGDVEPVSDVPYVVVYGRDRCGLTQRMLRELAGLGVPFDYQQIDDRAVADPLHERMQRAGISTARYMLPVVDVSGRLLVSPKPPDVADEYLAARSAGSD
jgi:hypothetical protein